MVVAGASLYNGSQNNRKYFSIMNCLCENCVCVVRSRQVTSKHLAPCLCGLSIIAVQCAKKYVCKDCRKKYPIYRKKVKISGWRKGSLQLSIVEGLIQENFGEVIDENLTEEELEELKCELIFVCRTVADFNDLVDEYRVDNLHLWSNLKELFENQTPPEISRKESALEQLRSSNIQRLTEFMRSSLGVDADAGDITTTNKRRQMEVITTEVTTTEVQSDSRKITSRSSRRARANVHSLRHEIPRWTLKCPFGDCLDIEVFGDISPNTAMQGHFNRRGCTKDVLKLIAKERIDDYFGFLNEAVENSQALQESECEIRYPEYDVYNRAAENEHGAGDGGDGGGDCGEPQQAFEQSDVEPDAVVHVENSFLQTIHKLVDFAPYATEFDYQLPEQDDNPGFVAPVFPTNPEPSEIVFNLQKRLMSEYAATNTPVKARKKRRSRDSNGEFPTEEATRVVINPDNLVRFYHHCVTHNVRGKEASQLLRLFHDMGTACGSVIPMPKTFTAIKEACGKRISKLFQIQRIDLALQPSHIFSQHRQKLTPTRGVSMCILEVLAKALLEINPSSFITEPDEQTTLLRDFTTGSYFSAMCRALRTEFGENAKPLLLSVTLDKTTLNSARTQSACPVLLYIMNAIQGSFKPIFLGYAPVELAYEEEDLAAIFGEIGINVDACKKTLFQIAKRRAMNDFLFHVLSPILQFQSTGMRVVVGRKGPSQKEEVVFPHYSHFLGDNEQQDSLAQVSNRGLRHQCRSCNQDQCGGLDNCYPCVGTVRSDRLNAFLSEASERLYVEYIDSVINKLAAPQWIGNKSKAWEATTFWNIKPGLNRLYDLIKWQSIRGLNSFHQMFPADFLHTFLKGLIENLISWCLIIIEAIGELDSDYSTAPIALDKTIQIFPIHELPVVRMVKFPRGLRYCLKLTTTTKKLHSGTNFLSGGFEAWKLASMMVQFLFSVGSSGTYCPNDPAWYANVLLPCLNKGLEGGKKHTAISKMLVGKSVNQVIVNSMSSALQCLFCLKSGSFSDVQLDTVDLLLKNARIHHARVFKLKFLVCAALRLQTRDFEDEKHFAGTKIHHLMHYVMNMKRLGGTTQSWDTESSELMHKIVGKAAFEASSKTKKGMLEEMVRYVQKRGHAQALLLRVVECTEGSTESKNSDLDNGEGDPATFEHPSNTRKQNIRFDTRSASIIRVETGVKMEDSRKIFLHGLIKLTDILRVLHKNRADETVARFLSGSMLTTSLVTNLKWKKESSEHVLLRANPEFKNDPKELNTQKFPVFSSLNYCKGSQRKTAKIMAIIEFPAQSFYLIVLPYKARTVQVLEGETNFYGCENLSYATTLGSLDFKLVKSQNVASQAFVCPNIDTQNYRCKELEFDIRWRFHSIPYDQARPALQVHRTYLSYSTSFPNIFQSETQMIVLQSFATVGSRVLCNQFDMGLWLEGKITSMCGEGNTFEILFDFSPVPEDKRERNVPMSRLKFNIKGGRACWRDTADVWSMGTFFSEFTADGMVTILADGNGIQYKVVVNSHILFIGQLVDHVLGEHRRKDCSIQKFIDHECCVLSTGIGEETVFMRDLQCAILPEQEVVLPWGFIVGLRCYASFEQTKSYYEGSVTGREAVGGAYNVTFDDNDTDIVPCALVDFRLVNVQVIAKVVVKQASAEASAKHEWKYGTISTVNWEEDRFLVTFPSPNLVELDVKHDRMLFVGKRVSFESQKWVIRKLHCRRGLCDIIKCSTNEIRERIAPSKLKLIKKKKPP